MATHMPGKHASNRNPSLQMFSFITCHTIWISSGPNDLCEGPSLIHIQNPVGLITGAP